MLCKFLTVMFKLARLNLVWLYLLPPVVYAWISLSKFRGTPPQGRKISAVRGDSFWWKKIWIKKLSFFSLGRPRKGGERYDWNTKSWKRKRKKRKREREREGERKIVEQLEQKRRQREHEERQRIEKERRKEEETKRAEYERQRNLEKAREEERRRKEEQKRMRLEKELCLRRDELCNGILFNSRYPCCVTR